MTKDEVLKFQPPAGRLLGREVRDMDTVNGAATLRYTARGRVSEPPCTVQGGILAAILDSAASLALYAVLPAELRDADGVVVATAIAKLRIVPRKKSG